VIYRALIMGFRSVRNGGLGSANLGALGCSEASHLSVRLVVRFHIRTGVPSSDQAPSLTALVSGKSPIPFQGVLTESVGFFVGSSGQQSNAVSGVTTFAQADSRPGNAVYGYSQWCD
jgi:hypothetical protein